MPEDMGLQEAHNSNNQGSYRDLRKVSGILLQNKSLCTETRDKMGHLGVNNIMPRAQVNSHHLVATVWAMLRDRSKRRGNGM